MAIDYTVDVVDALFLSDVASSPAYQIPGTFGLPAGFGLLHLSGGSIGTAGTGYSVSNILTLSGGTSSIPATIKVTAVNAGVVTAFVVLNPGAYTILPTNPVSTTGGNGTFTLNATWTGLAQQRVLTFIEIMRSYLNEIDNAHEAKLLQEVMARMMATMHFGAGVGGAGWAGTTVSTNARTAALRFIAHHVLATDL